MLKVWAEKEKRNLDRSVKNGINCQTAVVIKDHALVMEFIGIFYLLHEQVLFRCRMCYLSQLSTTPPLSCWPAPRLKDAALSLEATKRM
ncbi:uncharacterized protein LOC126801192 isoform X2 [Argentina anserina]|uniref:uncharacterized protein LOC126801192 isoform X2 n=1 Tax=Argentina anserina TaxID=57926 RepID=UPI00217642D5|nr:uncharacterized protein LOC126801192 isoform X2 [Potentilla anserina]